MSSTIRAARADGKRRLDATVDFVRLRHIPRGGPGHGKTVISSYLVPMKRPRRRGIVLVVRLGVDAIV